MSIESKSPSVYQYGAQPYPSFPTTPFLSKPINHESISPFTNTNNNLIQSNQTINYVRHSQPNHSIHPINYPTFSTTPTYQPITINTPIIDQQNVQYTKPIIQISSKPFQLNPASHKNQIEIVQEDDKYDEYLNESKQYKYNLFSIIDQPWNNCINDQKCSTIPDNQCVAKSNYKKYWY